MTPPIERQLPPPEGVTLDTLLETFDRAVVEKWTLSSYRAWYRRQKGKSEPTGRGKVTVAAVNAALRAMSPSELTSIKDRALSFSNETPPAKKPTS